MTNVLLTKDYKGKKGGTLLTGLHGREAATIERLGLGQIVKEPATEEKPARKGDKAVQE